MGQLPCRVLIRAWVTDIVGQLEARLCTLGDAFAA